jgi:tripartite-type tricarboxylate transporter receptor subunit TctC
MDLSAAAALHAQENFYKDKTIRLIVGSTPGGFYDRWGRLFARYMPKYIPGNPEIIVQNMPGAGSLVAANYVYKVAKPDGLTMGIVCTPFTWISLWDATKFSLTCASSVGLDLR